LTGRADCAPDLYKQFNGNWWINGLRIEQWRAQND